MSEYQIVAFRAIDSPVSEKNLEFMRRQSTRAEVTPWTFDNEYHFGDFRGDELEMLRRGYDVHFHYANFGTRKLLIRFPHGLPDPHAAKPYFGDESLEFLKDPKGKGGILSIDPSHEPGDLDEEWNFDEQLKRILPLRAEILDGDLRPLYLAHLVMACDNNHDPDETTEAPVPAGLGQLTDAQEALAEMYALSDALLAAAAEGSPPLGTKEDRNKDYAAWLQTQAAATKDAWLAQWLSDPKSAVRQEILEAFRLSRETASWPTVRLDRTITQLNETATGIEQREKRKAADKAARQRARKLADMKADPAPTLRETERLVKQRSTDSYAQLASLLADLREALAGSNQASLPDQQAQKLRRENPTLTVLVSQLRRAGFLQK
jgi:hypothetical protein